jgi:peptide/nickel transport system substrate-binding protein
MSALYGEGASEAGKTSRRRFLRDTAVAGATLTGGPAFLTACGGSTAASTSQPNGEPKKGGVLHVGLSGGGGRDTLDAQKGLSICDFARDRQLYDALADRGHKYSDIVPALGTEFIPGPNGESMMVKLREGVTFHNGKPLTAADVVSTYRRTLDPKQGAQSYAAFSLFLKGVEAIDHRTVRFKFKFPFNNFKDFASTLYATIVPVGYDPNRPVGTGPFKFKSFTPGQQSVFTRNENYWGADVKLRGSGGPYVDSVVITDIPDDSTRLNALLSGSVHAIDSVPYALMSTVKAKSNLALLVSQTGNWNPIAMRVDQPPFSDNRVRQAFKLIADRSAIVADAYGGQARIGNDLFGIDDPLYAHDIPQRTQDIEKAKFLLKQAGHEGLTVDLVTAPIASGVVQSCVVFSEQAKAAGVNVQLTKLDNTTFYNNQYEQRTFSVDQWSTLSLKMYALEDTAGPSAIFNETHYNNPQYNKWVAELLSTSDATLQKELAHKMQQQLWNEGGLIIPSFTNVIDAYDKKVTGFLPDGSGFNLGYFDFRSVWFV